MRRWFFMMSIPIEMNKLPYHAIERVEFENYESLQFHIYFKSGSVMEAKAPNAMFFNDLKRAMWDHEIRVVLK